ncbi:hypothetical protein TSMEX_000380 [Taenia solium]|eukprot:TsM_000655600 transcript=TsM_000655600 gene=TsM_000655600
MEARGTFSSFGEIENCLVSREEDNNCPHLRTPRLPPPLVYCLLPREDRAIPLDHQHHILLDPTLERSASSQPLGNLVKDVP